jgi:hypothetical protein
MSTDVYEDEDLGAAAAAGVGDDVDQPALVPEGTKIKFVGVNFDDTENRWQLGDEAVFLVRGRVTGETEEIMADGHHRNTLKVEVRSVIPQESPQD